MEAPALHAVLDNLVLAEEDGRQDGHFGYFDVLDARRRLALAFAVAVLVVPAKVFAAVLAAVLATVLTAPTAFAAARTWFPIGYHHYSAAAAARFQRL